MSTSPRKAGARRAWRALRLFAIAFVVLHVIGLLVAFTYGEGLANAMIVGGHVTPDPSEPPPADVRDVVEVARAGARIRAWMIDPGVAPFDRAPRGTVFVLHGIRDSKRTSLGAARAHARRGYRVIAVDSRGHGESTGQFLTYGVEEARDLRAMADELERRGLLAPPLAVVGTSYGGATAIQYAALDPRVKKLVAIAPFASLREVVPAYVHYFLGAGAAFVPSFWVKHRIDEAGRTAGFDPDQACPRCVAPKVRAETLLIASRDDERIPYQQSVAIRDAMRARAELLLVDGAHHVEVGKAKGVPEAVARWLDRPAP